MSRFLIILLFLSACAVNKSTQSMHPFSGDAIGCGDFIVYKLTEDNTEYISVIIDMSAIELQQTQAYAISKADVAIITRKKFDGPVNLSLCADDIPERPNEILQETAQSGIIELLVSDAQRTNKENSEAYTVTLILKKVVFNSVTIDYLRIEDVEVGWLPG